MTEIEEVLALRKEGLSYRKIADRLDMHISRVRRIIEKHDPSAKASKGKGCIICGAPRGWRLKRPVCESTDCLEKYILRLVAEARVEDECLIWDGPMCSNKSGGAVPGLHSNNADIRVRQLMLREVGRPVEPRRRVLSTCGNVRCVNLEHFNAPDNREAILKAKPAGDFTLDQVRLDPRPLDAAFRRWTINRPEVPMEDYRNSQTQIVAAVREGRLMSLRVIDEICCDILGVHPYAIYGEEYFTGLEPLENVA